MDTIHDLGGRQGFGRVDTHEKEEAFHSDWEARIYGTVRAMTRPGDWSIDWFRHCRELTPPVDYLTRNYYDQWLQAYAAMLVNSGYASVEEIVAGKAAGPAPDAPPPMTGEFVRTTAKNVAIIAERDCETPPAYAPGDKVTVRSAGAPGHTRLPAYLRGRRGVVEAYRGTHILPDANALGEERAEPLYTVGFNAAELWPDAEDSRDRMYADMWESYFEPV